MTDNSSKTMDSLPIPFENIAKDIRQSNWKNTFEILTISRMSYGAEFCFHN